VVARRRLGRAAHDSPDDPTGNTTLTPPGTPTASSPAGSGAHGGRRFDGRGKWPTVGAVAQPQQSSLVAGRGWWRRRGGGGGAATNAIMVGGSGGPPVTDSTGTTTAAPGRRVVRWTGHGAPGCRRMCRRSRDQIQRCDPPTSASSGWCERKKRDATRPPVLSRLPVARGSDLRVFCDRRGNFAQAAPPAPRPHQTVSARGHDRCTAVIEAKRKKGGSPWQPPEGTHKGDRTAEVFRPRLFWVPTPLAEGFDRFFTANSVRRAVKRSRLAGFRNGGVQEEQPVDRSPGRADLKEGADRPRRREVP
jgi:hypothetical protein